MARATTKILTKDLELDKLQQMPVETSPKEKAKHHMKEILILLTAGSPSSLITLSSSRQKTWESTTPRTSRTGAGAMSVCVQWDVKTHTGAVKPSGRMARTRSQGVHGLSGAHISRQEGP